MTKPVGILASSAQLANVAGYADGGRVRLGTPTASGGTRYSGPLEKLAADLLRMGVSPARLRQMGFPVPLEGYEPSLSNRPIVPPLDAPLDFRREGADVSIDPVVDAVIRDLDPESLMPPQKDLPKSGKAPKEASGGEFDPGIMDLVAKTRAKVKKVKTPKDPAAPAGMVPPAPRPLPVDMPGPGRANLKLQMPGEPDAPTGPMNPRARGITQGLPLPGALPPEQDAPAFDMSPPILPGQDVGGEPSLSMPDIDRGPTDYQGLHLQRPTEPPASPRRLQQGMVPETPGVDRWTIGESAAAELRQRDKGPAPAGDGGDMPAPPVPTPGAAAENVVKVVADELERSGSLDAANKALTVAASAATDEPEDRLTPEAVDSMSTEERTRKHLSFLKELLGEDDDDKARDQGMILALMGFAIASGQSPFAMTNIGAGMLAGVQAARGDRASSKQRADELAMVAFENALDERAAELDRASAERLAATRAGAKVRAGSYEQFRQEFNEIMAAYTKLGADPMHPLNNTEEGYSPEEFEQKITALTLQRMASSWGAGHPHMQRLMQQLGLGAAGPAAVPRTDPRAPKVPVDN